MQYAKPLTPKAKKLMRLLGPLRLQISLGQSMTKGFGRLELLQEADNLVVIADDQQLYDVGLSTEQDTIS